MTQVKPYWKQRSAYWGPGHWIISEHGRDMGRMSQEDNGKWSVYVEILPPARKGKVKAMTPIAEGVDNIDAGYRVLADHWLKVEARRSGQEHGWDHANYIEAYGAGPKLKPGEPGALAKTMPLKYARTHYINSMPVGSGTFGSETEYRAGWAQGVRWFKAGKNNDGTKRED